jgi:hypothetical protein
MIEFKNGISSWKRPGPTRLPRQGLAKDGFAYGGKSCHCPSPIPPARNGSGPASENEWRWFWAITQRLQALDRHFLDIIEQVVQGVKIDSITAPAGFGADLISHGFAASKHGLNLRFRFNSDRGKNALFAARLTTEGLADLSAVPIRRAMAGNR